MVFGMARGLRTGRGAETSANSATAGNSRNGVLRVSVHPDRRQESTVAEDQSLRLVDAMETSYETRTVAETIMNPLESGLSASRFCLWLLSRD